MDNTNSNRLRMDNLPKNNFKEDQESPSKRSPKRRSGLTLTNFTAQATTRGETRRLSQIGFQRDLEFKYPEVYCTFHKDCLITKICTRCYTEKSFLFCDMCSNHNKQCLSHEKSIQDFRSFMENLLLKLPQRFEKEDKESTSLMEHLFQMHEEASFLFFDYEQALEKEKIRIIEDFELIFMKIDHLHERAEAARQRHLNQLEKSIEEARKLLESLNALKNEKSQILQKSEGLNLKNLLKSLSNTVDYHDVQKSLSLLIKELIYWGERIDVDLKVEEVYEVESMDDRTLSKYDDRLENMNKGDLSLLISNLMIELRLKMKYPPKYKAYQNSEADFENFIKSLDSTLSQAEKLPRLLMSQKDMTFSFEGFSTPENEKSVRFSENNLGALMMIKESRVIKEIEIATSIRTNHKRGITCIAAFGSKRMITGSKDYTIKIWDLLTIKPIKTIRCESIPFTLLTLYSDTGQKLLISGHAQGFIAVFSEELKVVHVFQDQESVISSLTSLDDNRTVLAGSYDSTILMFDAVEGKILAKINTHSESVNCLEFSPIAGVFASGSDDCTIKIWSPIGLPERLQGYEKYLAEIKENPQKSSGKTALSFQKAYSFQEEFIPSSVTSFDSRTPRKAKTEERLENLPYDNSLNNGHAVKCMKFSNINPRILFSNCYNLIKMWDIKTNNCLMKFSKHEHYIYKIAIFEQRVLNAQDLGAEAYDLEKVNILSFGEDHLIKLWNGASEASLTSVKDQLPGFSVSDPFGAVMLVLDEKENELYALSSADKSTILNIWMLKKASDEISS